MEQETQERQQWTETVAAPLEQDVRQLRQALDQAQEAIQELKHQLVQEAEARRQLTENLSESAWRVSSSL